MTVIAFDGKTVATDRQSTMASGYISQMTKLHRADDGSALAVTGQGRHIVALVAWYNGGRDPNKFPAMDPNEHSTLVVFKAGSHPVMYEGAPLPSIIEDRLFADGTGKGPAMGAMLAGATAEEAVKIASQVMACCGQGVDVLELTGDATGEGSPAAAAAGTEASARG